MAITPDGQLVLAAVFGANQVVFIYTPVDAVIGQEAVPNPHNIAISPDGHTAYVAAQKQGSTGLSILDIDQAAQTGFIPLDKTPRALNFSPDGKWLYFTQAGVDAVQVLDPAMNAVVDQIPVGASPHHPMFTPDGKAALVVSQGPGQLSIIDAQKDQVSKVVTVGNAPRKIVIQPQVPTAVQQPKADPAGLMTSIQGMAFADQDISIRAGEQITWINRDSIAHTVTSDQGLWDSGNIDPGLSFSLTLKQPGQYSYHCSNHPFMTGTITVT